jgi:hypothetical protein
MFYKQPPSVYTIIENFYDRPEDIIALAKDFPLISCGPPKTLMLDQLDRNLNETLLHVFLNFYGGPQPGKRYELKSFFSNHEHKERGFLNQGQWRTSGHNPNECRYSDSAESIVLCGQVMLTENVEPGSEFQMGKVKPELNWTRQQFIDETCNYYSIPKEKYFAGEFSYEQFEECYLKHENNYMDVLTVKYEFNKLVFWRGETVHREKRNQPLLTQHIVLAEYDRT